MSRVSTVLCLVIVVGGAVLLAVLNLGTAPGSPLHVSTFVVSLAGKYLCYAMLALALDLVWGFAGILSLGHAAFFALGGYAMGFGGNNGLTDFKDIFDLPLHADATRVGLLVVTALFLAAQLLLARYIVTSRFGKVLIAVRDTENRTRFLGYHPETYKLFVFVLSAIMAGIGGALYVPQIGIINPGEFSSANSIEAVIWVAVGGRGTLVGAILGAVLVNFGKTIFTGILPEV
jgi:urea transport system permease protein